MLWELPIYNPKMKANVIFEEGDSQLIYLPDFATNQTIDQLLHETQLRQNHITIFGQTHLEPRLTAWYGPPYRYANVQWDGQKMPFHIEELASQVRSACNFDFNAVLINYYRNGDDSMGWHRDNEKELDHRTIASLSFGGTRTFKIRNRTTKATLNLALEHGSLLIMQNMQTDYEHALPKRRKLNQARLNLTFRRIRS